MKVWITYAYEDKEFVERIKAQLRKADLDILDVENEILPGDNIVESIYQSISQAELIIVVISKASNERQWFSTEVGLIISEIRNNRHKKIIPILKDRGAVIPPFIDQYQYLDLTENRNLEEQINRLIATLKLRERNHVNPDELALQTSELLLSRREMLERELYEYEKKQKLKQKLLTVTFLTTLLATFLTALSFLLWSKNVFPFLNDSTLMRTLVTLMTAVFIGVIVNLFLNQLKKK